MILEKWVKDLLRVYMCREVDLEYLTKELKAYDAAIDPRISDYSFESRRGSNQKSSVVEYYLVKRDKFRRKIEREINQLHANVALVERALQRLTVFHRNLIRETFFTLNNEQEIAKGLGIPLWQLSSHKKAALLNLKEALLEEYRDLRKEKGGLYVFEG